MKFIGIIGDYIIFSSDALFSILLLILTLTIALSFLEDGSLNFSETLSEADLMKKGIVYSNLIIQTSYLEGEGLAVYSPSKKRVLTNVIDSTFIDSLAIEEYPEIKDVFISYGSKPFEEETVLYEQDHCLVIKRFVFDIHAYSKAVLGVVACG